MFIQFKDVDWYLPGWVCRKKDKCYICQKCKWGLCIARASIKNCLACFPEPTCGVAQLKALWNDIIDGRRGKRSFMPSQNYMRFIWISDQGKNLQITASVSSWVRPIFFLLKRVPNQQTIIYSHKERYALCLTTIHPTPGQPCHSLLQPHFTQHKQILVHT